MYRTRFPRSLSEAFGPYTSQHITEQRKPHSIASVLLAVALGFFAALFIAHYAATGF